MRFMMMASLLLNIIVLLPVCFGLVTGAGWADAVYGSQTPARGILLAVYAVLGLASCALLAFPEPRLVAFLLMLQVGYKLLSPLTVGSLSNSVVVSNVLIAAFHLITLVVIWSSETQGSL